MRVATLQFAPELGEVSANIDRANAILGASRTPLQDIDLLVLPELAFSGYNHPSLDAIAPFLEPTGSGPSTAWAKATAAKLNCIVSVGYPELHVPPGSRGASLSLPNGNATTASTENNADATPQEIIAYNSTVTVSPHGAILAHYRKTHLYYTDETWAHEGPTGFKTTTLTKLPSPSSNNDELTRIAVGRRVAWGICMDLNPYKFTAPWQAYEFARTAISSSADMLVVSMAWLTSLSPEELASAPTQPDMRTFSYWAERLMPLVEAEREVVVVMANRCGEETGGHDHLRREGVRYAGSSWVGTVGGGRIRVWEMLGKAEEGVLLVDLKNGLPKYTFSLGPVNHEEVGDEEEEEEDNDDDGDDDDDGGGEAG